MTIICVRCGRPVCELDIPDSQMTPLKQTILTKTARGFGIDLTEFAPQMDILLNPTAEKLAMAFNVRHPEGCLPA